MASKDVFFPGIGNDVAEQSEDNPNPTNLNCPTENESPHQTLKQVNETPEAGEKGNDAGHGNRFQSQLLMLYAVRAINLCYHFYLGTELPDVGEKFDDLIFQYKDVKWKESDSNAITKKIYLQSKHRLDEKKRITTANLLGDNKTDTDTGDFSLLKYFQSYIKISRNNDDIDNCIVCTNVNFHQNDLKRNGITLEHVDKEDWPKLLDCTDFKPQQTCYKLKVAYEKFKSISCERKRNWLKNYTKDEIEYLFKCIKEKIPILFINCTEKVNGKPFSDCTADEKEHFFTQKSEKEIKNFFATCEETIVADIFEGFLSFLDDFLNKLVFVVKMPNKEELNSILTKDVGDHFQLSNAKLPSDSVMKEMINWFKLQTNLWLTAEEAKSILEEKVGQPMKLGNITSLSIEYQVKQLKKEIVKFNDLSVNLLTCSLETFWDQIKEIKLMRINSKTPKLTAVKVISAINVMKNFQNKDDYLVISLKCLKENKNELQVSLKTEKCHQLLVIVDEDAENPLEDDWFYKNLMIPKDSKKKLILISSKHFRNESFKDVVKYEDLHEDTKANIGEIKVSFQGTDLTIKELVDMRLADEIIDSLSIEDLLQVDDTIKIVIPSFNSSSFNQDLYIETKMKFPLESQLLKKLAEAMDNNISEEIDRISDGPLDKTEEKRDKKRDFLNKKETKKIMEEIQIDSNGKIQWLIDEDERKKKIWEKLQFLLEQNELKGSSLLSEIHTNNNRIIITGVAGTGKSTILSNYYQEMKKVNPDKLVIKISLMNYSKALMNERSIQDFLINNVMNQNAFARQLLKNRLKTGDRIILMLDGFDEIDSICQETIVELVKTLNESIPLYITTRPHLADKLEFELLQLAYRLDKFTEEDQINYLTFIWESYLKEVMYKEETIKIFANHLIDQISKTLKDKEKEFIGIPLQCRILAECFQSKIKEEMIKEPNTDLSHLIDEDQQFDLATLYKSLIDEKRRLFRQEKIKVNTGESHIVDDSIKEEIEKTERHLRKLAVQTIVYKQNDIDILIPPSSAGFKSELMRKKKEKQLNEFGIRFGLVDAKGENGIQFLHRSYAEYLVADFIFNGFLLDDDQHNNLLGNESARKWIINEVLVKDNYEGVRVFFDSMLKEILNDKEWRNGIQNNNLPVRMKQFTTFLSSGEVPAFNIATDVDFFFQQFRYFHPQVRGSKIWPLERAFLEINANITLFIFDCFEVTFHETPSKIPSVINYSLHTVIRKPSFIFRQRIDVFDRLFNYFDNVEYNEFLQFIEELCFDLSLKCQHIEKKKLECFLAFVGRHVKNDWTFENLTVFSIRSKIEEQIRHKFFEILTSKYSIDFNLTQLMKSAINKSLERHNCQIGEIEKALFILRDLGRINVAGDLSRFVLLRQYKTLQEKGNDIIRSSLEKMGMTGLHGAAFKGDVSLIERKIGCSLENPENCSEEERKAVLLLMTNEKDLVPPLYLAAAYGHDDICKKIFRFLDLKKEISDKKGFLYRSLKDAIEYENFAMIQTILKHVKKIQDQNDLVKLLQIVISNIHFNLNKMQVETIINIIVQDTGNGYKELNDWIFFNWSTLQILKHVRCDVLQKMVTAAGGFDYWSKRLIDTDLAWAFGVLSSDGFLDKLNRLNHISKLIEILINNSSLNNTIASSNVLTLIGWWGKIAERRRSSSTSYWSNFVKESWPWEMRKFLEGVSKCASEEGLKRLLLSRNDNNVLVVLQFFIWWARDVVNDILSVLPEHLKTEIEDLSEEEKPKLIDHFFSTPRFLESLEYEKRLNAIEYYLEYGNEKQLSKFSQVVQVHQLENTIENLDSSKKENGKRILALMKNKIDSHTFGNFKNLFKKLWNTESPRSFPVALLSQRDQQDRHNCLSSSSGRP